MGGGYGYEGQSMSLPKWPTSQNSLAEALMRTSFLKVVRCTQTFKDKQPLIEFLASDDGTFCSQTTEQCSEYLPGYLPAMANGAFHDRSTKKKLKIYTRIFYFLLKIGLMGCDGRGTQLWQGFFSSNNGFRDIASGSSWRSRCNPMFGGL